MSPIRKAAAALAFVGSTIAGGALGAALVNSSANAATTTTTPAATAPANPAGPGGPGAPGAAPGGVFHSNENAAHEAGESAAREAQENAGQFPTIP